MPTVAEILKQSGMTDEQITALDARVMQGFTAILSTSEQAAAAAAAEKEAAELLGRKQRDMWEKEINPALNTWGTEKANYEARIAFYEKQNEEAKKNGFIAAGAPGAPSAAPAKDPETGKFVATETGSPKFLTIEQGANLVANATWAMQEHLRLFGKPPEDDLAILAREASDQHMPFRDHVSKKYGFETKRAELRAAEQKAHDDKIREEAVAAIRKEIADKQGNPSLRAAASSQFSSVRKAVEKGQFKSPVLLSKEQRREQTRQMIANDMADHAAETIQ